MARHSKKKRRRKLTIAGSSMARTLRRKTNSSAWTDTGAEHGKTRSKRRAIAAFSGDMTAYSGHVAARRERQDRAKAKAIREGNAGAFICAVVNG
jgi:hypothetical protein